MNFKHISIALLALIFTSCVSLSKYQDLEKTQQAEQLKNEELLEANRKLKATSNESDSEISKLRKDIESLEGEKDKNFEDFVSAKEESKKYQELYKDLLATKFSSGISSDDTKALLKKLQSFQDDLQTREEKLRQAKADLFLKQKKVNSLSGDILEKNRRLEILERELRKKDSLNKIIKDAIAKALLNFKDKGFDVVIRDGKVYVSLDNKLLFASGKYNVKPEGKKAIGQLANAIAKNKDIHIMVEGHTDDVPYRGAGVISDNWDLSVRRATSVVKILLAGGNIKGKQITASGRSKYDPKINKKTTTARAKNRRIEIIISPNLNEIYKIVTE
jgi:chemotaxis protein MotB